MVNTRPLFTVALACAVLGSAYANAGEILYTITDLGTLGGPTSIATSISQNGIIAGGAEVPQRGNRPYVYQGSGPMQNLGMLYAGGATATAQSVNSKGQVVGLSDVAGANEPQHGFLYNDGGPLFDLGTLGGQTSSALQINESGQIAGGAQTASGAEHGVLWTVSGGSVTTIDLGGGFLATALNNRGLIGGESPTGDVAMIYNLSSGSVTDITLGGGRGSVSAINDNGLVVGFSDTPTGWQHAILYDVNTGVLTDLGNLSYPGGNSAALGVNNLGQVFLGSDIDAAGDSAAFIYSQAGGMQNLNNFIDPSSGWNLLEASGGNDAGQIIGEGINPQGQFHAFLLTPLPEPSTLELLLLVLTVVTARVVWARGAQNCQSVQALRRLVVLFTIVFACAFSADACANDILYSVTDLGTFGGPTSVATAISENGIIVGNAQLSPSYNRPYVYQGTGPMQNLGLLYAPGYEGTARSVNSQGQVVGESEVAGANDPDHAFLFNGSFPLIDLGTLGGQTSDAHGINESGQIVGVAQTAPGAVHGVLWSVSGGTVATVDLGAAFLPSAINNKGLLGGASTQTGDAAIYNLSSGSITDFDLGGHRGRVTGINDNGLAVGFSDAPTGWQHAVLYDVNTGVLTDLGNLIYPEGTSAALGVNNLGQVFLGAEIDAAGDNAAFIYTQAGGMQNLNNLIDPSSGWNLLEACGGNDAGQIIGDGTNPQGQFHAFLLTPVPEPSTLQLTIILLTILAGRLTLASRRAKQPIPRTLMSVTNPLFPET